MGRDSLGRWAALGASGLVAGWCWAQAPAEPLGDRPASWQISFEPSAWFVAPGGRIRMPGGGTSSQAVKLEDLNLDSPRVSPYPALSARLGEWSVSASAMAVSLDDRGSIARQPGRIGGVSFAAGEELQNELDYFTAELTVGRDVALPGALGRRDDPDLRARLTLLGGLRVHHYDISVSAGGGSSSHRDFFAAPVIGAEFAVDLAQRFTIDLKVDVSGFAAGGNRSTWGGNVQASFEYRPVEWVGVQIGYRFLINDATSGEGADEFHFDGGFAGVFAGVVARF